MTPAEMQELKKLIIIVASYYDRDLRPEVVSMMANDLSQYNFQAVKDAYDKYRITDKSMKFPMPAQIISLINPLVEERNVAVDIARKLIKAVHDKGSWWSDGVFGEDGMYYEGAERCRFQTWKEAAESIIGPIGVQAILSYGGWKVFCENVDNTESGTLMAQLRELIESKMKLSKAGIDVAQLQMPTPQNPQIAVNLDRLSLITDGLKRIPREALGGVDE